MVGYVNIDKYDSHADKRMDAGKLDYADGGVDEIYTSHMVEHVAPKDFQAMLCEWQRVLKSGGKLTIRCPNIEVYLKRWLAGDYKLRWGERLHWLLGSYEHGEGHFNRNFFEPQRMQEFVAAAGFRIEMCKAYQTRSGHMKDGDILCVAYK